MGRVAAIRHDPSPPPPPHKLGQGSAEANLSRSIGGQVGRQNPDGNGLREGGSGVFFPSFVLFLFFSFLFDVVRSRAWDIGKEENGFPMEKYGKRDFGIWEASSSPINTSGCEMTTMTSALVGDGLQGSVCHGGKKWTAGFISWPRQC